MRITVRGEEDERGAIAIVTTLSLVGVMIAVALVLDFGLVRLDRQVNKSAADAAATSGLQAMGADVTKLRPWAGVCQALSYLKANGERMDALSGTFTDGAGNSIASPSPCDDPVYTKAVCTPDTATSWARYKGTIGPAADPDVTVEIKGGYKVSDGGFSEESYTTLANDPGVASKGGCDQLAVIITEKREPGLGSLATSADLKSRVRSVARVVIGEKGKAPVALLILERHDCVAISTDGSTTRLWAEQSGDLPGMIHSDSLGDTLGPTGGCTSSKIVGGSGQVKAFMNTGNGEPGVIGIRALLPNIGGVPENASDPSPRVIAEGQPGEAPEGRPLITRAPVDERYLAAVGAKAAQVLPLFNKTTATSAAHGYQVATVASCGGTGISGTFTGTKVYVDCPGGAVIDNATFTGTSVIFNGPVSVRSGGLLALPNAESLYIQGDATSSAANDVGLSVKGRFRIHDFADQPCSSADAAGEADPTLSQRAELVVARGQITAGGSPSSPLPSLMRMCSTTVIALGAGGIPPVYDYTDVSLAPVPQDNTMNGNVSLVGGSSQDWTAPNMKVNVEATPAEWAQFEDLALWTETSAESSIGGGGNMTLSGVFMLPNANPFSIGGNGTQVVENSQYIARKLNAHGGGTLSMAPDPNDVVKVNYSGDYVLVR